MQPVHDKKTLKPKHYKADNINNDWCPGCGDFGILSAIQMALAKLQLPPHKVALVSGIGCSGKTPHYVHAYGFHTLHGRLVPHVTGLKLANEDLTVIGIGGDGDSYGIGGGHFVAGGRRNLDFTYIVFNNDVYALTKGQASPTIQKGYQTKTMPEPSIYEPINPIALAVSSGYTFVARSYALDVKYTADLIVQAIQHPGSAVIDVLQTCPAFNDIHTKTWYEGLDKDDQTPRYYKLDEESDYNGVVTDPDDDQEIADKKAGAIQRSMEQNNERFPIGLFYQQQTMTLEDHLHAKMPTLGKGGLVWQDIYNRDIDPLFDELR